jgi:hypothetical protein
MITRHKRRTPAVIESLESRRLLSSSMLHAVGNHLVDASGQTVRLTGVNIPSLAWSNTGENVLQSMSVAVNTWKSNCIRLALTQDSWEGYTGSGSGAAYQAVVDSVVAQAQTLGVHVVLDLHWSDMGHWGSNIGQHDMPDDNSTTFWHDVATHYANNSAVLFDLYNEPHDVGWSVWENGGTITEGSTQYHTPGMQSLLNTVRATGAKNLVVVGGVNWSADDSGALNGYALSDTTGNGIMYDAHVYPWTSGNWDACFGNVSNTYPVLLGEVGHPGDNNPGFAWAEPYEAQAIFVPEILNYIDDHALSWTGWSFHPTAGPSMISDWNYTPTSYWGQPAKDQLAAESLTSASLVNTDTVTQGNWRGHYGADGYNVIGNASSYPHYATVTSSGTNFVWAASTSSVQALQKASNPNDRIAACWYGATIDVTLNVSGTRQVALYFLDWDSAGRSETVNAYDATTGASLAPQQTVSSFSGGKYLVYTVTGNVRFHLAGTAGPNVVLSGIFFGAAGQPTSQGRTLADPLNNLSFTNTTLNSSGWGIDSANSQYLKGDTGRAYRTSDTMQWLVWQNSNTSSFSAQLYYHSLANIASYVTFYASADGTTWTAIPATFSTPQLTGGGWNWTTATPSGALPAGTNYLKMQIVPTGVSWNIELGEMDINYG